MTEQQLREIEKRQAVHDHSRMPEDIRALCREVRNLRGWTRRWLRQGAYRDRICIIARTELQGALNGARPLLPERKAK